MVHEIVWGKWKWIQSSKGDILNGKHFLSGQERQERAAENYRAEVFRPQKRAAFVFMWGKPIPCVFLTPFQGDSAAGATCEAAGRSEETRVGGSGREERRGQERDAGAGKEERKWEGAGGEEQQHVFGVVQHEVARKSSWHRRESRRSCTESGEAGIVGSRNTSEITKERIRHKDSKVFSSGDNQTSAGGGGGRERGRSSFEGGETARHPGLLSKVRASLSSLLPRLQ